MNRLRPRIAKPKTLKPVRPNVGIQAAYQRRLDRLVDAMHRSLIYWLAAAYRAKPPELAQDDDGPAAGKSSAMHLRDQMRTLGARWQRQFDQAAPELAKYFATEVMERTDAALATILRDGGISVRFQMTAAANDAFQATIGENIALIKSISSQHLTQVQGEVMRSVQTGRDLGPLAKRLEEQYGVTKKRAAFIARSQNNIATATITRVRQEQLGITKAIWVHSSAGKHPRPEHVAADGKEYDVSKGMFLEGVWTWPGREPNCRCISRPIIEGFN